MYCTGCGTHPAVIGQFCSSCDFRARHHMFERRRPVGGGQWQALWGIRYSVDPNAYKRCQRLQWGIAVTAVFAAIVLMF